MLHCLPSHPAHFFLKKKKKKKSFLLLAQTNPQTTTQRPPTTSFASIGAGRYSIGRSTIDGNAAIAASHAASAAYRCAIQAIAAALLGYSLGQGLFVGHFGMSFDTVTLAHLCSCQQVAHLLLSQQARREFLRLCLELDETTRTREQALFRSLVRITETMYSEFQQRMVWSCP